MTPRPCPVPGCVDPVSPGRHAFFCTGHYFQVPAHTIRLITRVSIACSRCDDDDERRFLAEQRDAYVNVALHELEARHAA